MHDKVDGVGKFVRRGAGRADLLMAGLPANYNVSYSYMKKYEQKQT